MSIGNVSLGKNRLQEYVLQDVDDDGTTEYDGMINKDGEWFVRKFVMSGNSTTYSYANISNNSGKSTYASAWSDRATLNYTTFDALTGV